MIIYDEETNEIVAVIEKNAVVLTEKYNITKSQSMFSDGGKLYVNLEAEIVNLEDYKNVRKKG